MNSETLIEFKNVTKRFSHFTVMNNVNLKINKGEITTIIGKSGMGKTVLLKHIIGLMEPDHGEIIFEGRDLFSLSTRERKKLKQRIGYMFQNVALFDALDVYENIALPLRENTRFSEKEIRLKIEENLEKLEIPHISKKYPSEISGGMKKRVGLARALIMSPEIVLFDEPTTGLDPIRKNAVHSMISHMQKKFNFTGIIVSHEIPDVFYISQKIAMLDNGEIIADCSPQDIHNIDNPIVQQFIRGVENLKDELTGLHTKNKIVEKFTEEIKPEVNDSSISIMLFEINGLDKINESLGFVAGQKIIRHFANFIEQYLRISGEHSRFGDNSILTILPNTKIGMARILLEKLEQALVNYPSLPPQGYNPMSYSISAAVAEASSDNHLDDTAEKAKNEMKIIGYFDIK